MTPYVLDTCGCPLCGSPLTYPDPVHLIHSSQCFSPANRLDIPPISTSMAALDLLDTQVCSVARTTHHKGISYPLPTCPTTKSMSRKSHPILMCPVFLFLGVTLILWLSVQQWCEAFLYVFLVWFGHSMKTLSF